MYIYGMLYSPDRFTMLHQFPQFVLTIPNFSNIVTASDNVLSSTARSFAHNDRNKFPYKSLCSKLCIATDVIFPSVYAASPASEPQNETEHAMTRREQILEILRKESPKDRLRRMYSLNEFGILSPELQYVISTFHASFIVGGIWGLLTGANATRDNFMRRNVATAFESEHLARRSLFDKMIITGIRNGFLKGLKLSFCTTTYVLISTTVATCNYKITLFEHILAGALMAAIYKFNFGIKGMAAAGALGGVLGTFAGGAILLTMKLSGTTYEDLVYSQHEYYAPEIQGKVFLLEELKRVETE